MPKGLEIEKKFLIAYPDVDLLVKMGCKTKEIVQTYLTAEKGVSERVRKTVVVGRTVYTHTVKSKIRGIVRREDEWTIDEKEYRLLLERRDPECLSVEKTRYVLSENGFCYEIDVFPFWSDKAVLEVELEEENSVPPLPPFLTVLADVSENKEYTNHSLARQLKNNL